MWRFADERDDWDLDFDYDYPEETEWVPTEELAKLMEYDRRPGGADSHGDSERWKSLGDHIQDKGFGNAVIVDYNPDTQAAHLSEGNHRVQLALERGIPAVPARVYRSRRTSPTQVQMNPQPQPEWLDYNNEHHWPSSIKPSHIGLLSLIHI